MSVSAILYMLLVVIAHSLHACFDVTRQQQIMSASGLQSSVLYGMISTP